jgi:hypothetical protein
MGDYPKDRDDVRRHVADETDPWPSTPAPEDDGTPLGDTSEAHDEISPHDLPRGHPGRVAAERQADENAARGGERVTRGSR